MGPKKLTWLPLRPELSFVFFSFSCHSPRASLKEKELNIHLQSLFECFNCSIWTESCGNGPLTESLFSSWVRPVYLYIYFFPPSQGLRHFYKHEEERFYFGISLCPFDDMPVRVVENSTPSHASGTDQLGLGFKNQSFDDLGFAFGGCSFLGCCWCILPFWRFTKLQNPADVRTWLIEIKNRIGLASSFNVLRFLYLGLC